MQLDVDTDVDIRRTSSDELIRDIDKRDSVRPYIDRSLLSYHNKQ